LCVDLRCTPCLSRTHFFFLQSYGPHRYLHSFPTRRSSDLIVDVHEAERLLRVDGERAHGVAERTDAREDLVRAGIRNRESARMRSEEHTSELQSPCNLVCRLLLEKKKKTRYNACTQQGAHE